MIDGVLLLKEPQDPRHANGVRRVAVALRRVFGAGWIVEPGCPIALDDVSEPEPDVTVVAGTLEDYESEHPAHPVLVVEVSLTRRGLEVHRVPRRSRTARYGWGYAEVRTLAPGDTIAPVAAAGASLSVSDLPPRA